MYIIRWYPYIVVSFLNLTLNELLKTFAGIMGNLDAMGNLDEIKLTSDSKTHKENFVEKICPTFNSSVTQLVVIVTVASVIQLANVPNLIDC